MRDADVDSAIRFVRTLSKAPAAAELRTDLRALESRLEDLRGLTSARALASLMAEPPQSRKSNSRRRTRG